jgi:ribosome maturation factor RimP
MKEPVKSQLVQQIESQISDACSEEGYTVVEVLAGGGKTPHVTIFVFREEGVDVDSLAPLNHRIYTLLELIPALKSGFSLEVSSPGIFRKLKFRREFLIFQGQEMVITFTDGTKHTVTVTGSTEDTVSFSNAKGGSQTISMDMVKKAVLNG